PDNRIISCALDLRQAGKRVVFITKDINARIKSDALGLVTEDFEAQKVDFERLYTGYRELMVPSKTIDRAVVPGRAAEEPADRRARHAGQERAVGAGQPGDGGVMTAGDAPS